MKTIAMILILIPVSLAWVDGVSMARDDHGRRGRHEIHGVVERLPDSGFEGTWIVDGQKVLVTWETAIDQEHGRITIGSYVEVKGDHSGDIISARRIELKKRR
ncbi:MAG: DUF5666 domain-containing protein [Desulfobacterales bacterium]